MLRREQPEKVCITNIFVDYSRPFFLQHATTCHKTVSETKIGSFRGEMASQPDSKNFKRNGLARYILTMWKNFLKYQQNLMKEDKDIYQTVGKCHLDILR